MQKTQFEEEKIQTQETEEEQEEIPIPKPNKQNKKRKKKKSILRRIFKKKEQVKQREHKEQKQTQGVKTKHQLKGHKIFWEKELKWTEKAKLTIATAYAKPALNTIEKYWEGIQYEDIKQPLLILIRSNHKLEVYQDVQDGIFELDPKKPKKGREQEATKKGILLKNTKLLTLPAGTDESGAPRNIQLWIGYEDEAVTYPQEPKHDSILIVQYIEQIINNLDLLKDTGSSGWEKWLKWAMIAAIGLYLLYKFGVFNAIGNMLPQAAPVVKEATNVTVQAATQAMANTAVTVT